VAVGGSADTTGSPSGGVGEESAAEAAGGSAAGASAAGVHGRGVNALGADGSDAGGGVAGAAGGGVNELPDGDAEAAGGVGPAVGGVVGADTGGVDALLGGRYSSRLMSSARGGPSAVRPLLLAGVAGVAALALPPAGPLAVSLAELPPVPVPLTGPSGLAITVVSRGAASAGAVSAAGGR
jgi:hypothetical protein